MEDIFSDHAWGGPLRGASVRFQTQLQMWVDIQTDNFHVNVLLKLKTKHSNAKCYTQSFTSRNACFKILLFAYL